MVEQALYFAIGFLAALLVGVVWTPIVSRRAKRLAEARARLQAPLSERQAIADRDALRAEHAVQEVRLERRMTLAEEAAIGLRAELGRLSVKLIALETDAKQHESADFDRRAQIEALTSQCRDLEVGLGASQSGLHDLSAQRDRAAATEAAAVARQNELEAEASRARARSAILAARVENLEGRCDVLTRSAQAAAERAEAARAELDAEGRRARQLEDRVRKAIAETQGLAANLSKGDAQIEESQRRVANLEARLAASERVREETLIENGRQLAVLADREAALKAALDRTVELGGRLAQVVGDARANEDSASLRAQTLITAHSAMQGALRAAEAERQSLQRENEALRAQVGALTASVSNGPDDAALRESIERIGREVNRLFAEQKAEGPRRPRSQRTVSLRRTGCRTRWSSLRTTGGRHSRQVRDPASSGRPRRIDNLWLTCGSLRCVPIGGPVTR